MKRKINTAERGKFKQEIHLALYKNPEIRELLLGDTNGMSAIQMREEFKKHVKSHLFVEDTMTDADSYIFYDVKFPVLKPQVKHCAVLMYVICQRDTLDNYTKEGYIGNRADILAQMIEDTLLDEETARSFGIGELSLDSVDIYGSERFYGCILNFSVPNFR